MRLVKGAVREDNDLEFKAPLYGNSDKAKRDLAGDVSAMANTHGGVVVLGIEERDGKAISAPAVDLSDEEEVRMQQIIATCTAPYVPVTIRPIPLTADTSRGFYVLEVAWSTWAPHAVRVNNALRYPRRAGTTIRWLSESEVADAYRDRFVAAREQAERAVTVRTEGEVELNLDEASVWLSVALVPNAPGTMELTRHGINELRGLGRQITSPELIPSEPRHTTPDVRAGHRRAVLAFGRDQRGRPSRAVLHLHVDGAGYAGIGVGWIRPFEMHLEPPDEADVNDEFLTQAVIDALDVLASHAFGRCGVAGDALVEATLVTNAPMVLSHGRGFVGRGGRWYDAPISKAPIGRHTINLEDVVGSTAGLLVAVRLVVTDLVQGFGVAESPQLTADGAVRRKYFQQDVQQQVGREADRLGFEITDDTID